MTITNQYVPPIEAGALPGGLLTTARELPAGVDWTGGVTFEASCGTSGIWSCINDESEKEISDKPDPNRVDPFMVYAGQRCSGAPIIEELGTRAAAVLERAQSGLLATQLVVSDALVGNPDFSGVGTDLTPGTPTDFRSTVAGLLTAVKDCGGGEVMLHVPMIALPFMSKLGVTWNGEGWNLGPIPVSVDEYPNPDGDPPSDPDNATIYLSRPVEYALGDVVNISSYHGRTNEAIALVERLALVRFDPCCVYYATVDFGA